jgi:hypothetical protein
LQIGCNARGGFNGDIGGDTDEHEGIDACRAKNSVERGAVEPIGRLSPDDRLRAWTPMTPVFSARCRKSRLKVVSTWPPPLWPHDENLSKFAYRAAKRRRAQRDCRSGAARVA